MMRLVAKIFLIVMIVAAALGTILEALFGGRLRDGARSAPVAHSPAEGQLKTWSFRIVALLLAGAVAGFLIMLSGVMPIKASARHWPITAWVLNFAMRRSVVMHSLGTAVPALDDPALIAQGAGHYEFGCLPCHGGPDLPQPVVAQQMTPHPPYLPPEIPKWDADELFYIVKHGVKFTGMPAWPAQQRDDEIWAVVAFLLKLPQLTAGEYRELARSRNPGAPMDNLSAAEDAPRAVSESCARCHGMDGAGRGLSTFPILAGQRPTYLYASLLAFARGERHSGTMKPLATGLSAEDMREIAQYYAKLPRPSSSAPGANVQAAIERGREIASTGVPAKRVPACASCHGPGSTPRNPIYPDLAGQHSKYLALQLELFQKDIRGGTPYAHIMRAVAGRLTSEQIHDVARYYGSLAAAEKPAAREQQ
jgi:cytochrome c553